MLKIEISTKGTVNIKKESFENNNQLESLRIHADQSIVVESNAFLGCDSLKIKEIDSPDTKVDDCAFGDCKNKKKKLSVGAIIAIVVVCVAVIGVIVFCIVYFRPNSKKNGYENI